jgi:hypothetical protein
MIEEAPVADIDGKWAVEVATLAGSRRYDLTLATEGTTLSGTAVGAAGPVPIRNGTAVGDTAEFVLELAAPLPTTLVFELRVIGDRLTGTAQSGPFPPQNVLGTRMP